MVIFCLGVGDAEVVGWLVGCWVLGVGCWMDVEFGGGSDVGVGVA